LTGNILSSIRLFTSYIYINASTTYILARNRLSRNLPMTSNQSHLKHNVINMHKLTDTPPKLSDLNYLFTCPSSRKNMSPIYIERTYQQSKKCDSFLSDHIRPEKIRILIQEENENICSATIVAIPS
jgi:hypothetical protein